LNVISGLTTLIIHFFRHTNQATSPNKTLFLSLSLTSAFSLIDPKLLGSSLTSNFRSFRSLPTSSQTSFVWLTQTFDLSIATIERHFDVSLKSPSLLSPSSIDRFA
jgi:hypothetical protein